MNLRLFLALMVIGAALSTCTMGVARATEFVTLGQFNNLGDANMDVEFMSGDGSAVVGIATNENGETEPWQWTPEAGFVGLGTTPYSEFDVNVVSQDGSAVFMTGISNVFNFPDCCARVIERHLYRWTSDHGLSDLGLLPQPDYTPVGSGGHAVVYAEVGTSDGTVVAGSWLDRTHPEGFYSGFFIWSDTNGFTDLGAVEEIVDNNRVGNVTGISDSGEVVVGRITLGSPSRNFGFRWARETGMVSIGEGFAFFARDVSADGSVVIGSDEDYAPVGNIPYRYTEDAGVEMLGLLPHWVGATADRISADGSTITGRARLSGDSHEREPYLWTSEKGYETLPPPPGESDLVGIFTTQLIVSDDGSAIVGGIDNRPFMWRKELGTRFVDEMLANEFGMAEELEGWKLIGIRMSDDGSVIAGDAINPDGIREPWLVRLSPVPEPNTSMLLLVAAAGLASSGLKPTLFSRQ